LPPRIKIKTSSITTGLRRSGLKNRRASTSSSGKCGLIFRRKRRKINLRITRDMGRNLKRKLYASSLKKFIRRICSGNKAYSQN
jgi:hypothetical protein